MVDTKEEISESHLRNYNRIIGCAEVTNNAKDALHVLCRDCDDSGLYHGNAWQLHFGRCTIEAAIMDAEELVDQGVISFTQFEEHDDIPVTLPHERWSMNRYYLDEESRPMIRIPHAIQINNWESEQDQAFIFGGIKGSSPEMRLQSPQIKLLRQIVELAEKLKVSKAELCRQWGIANRQIYYYLKGDKLPSRRTFDKMTVTYPRLQLSATSPNINDTDQNSSIAEAS